MPSSGLRVASSSRVPCTFASRPAGAAARPGAAKARSSFEPRAGDRAWLPIQEPLQRPEVGGRAAGELHLELDEVIHDRPADEHIDLVEAELDARPAVSGGQVALAAELADRHKLDERHPLGELHDAACARRRRPGAGSARSATPPRRCDRRARRPGPRQLLAMLERAVDVAVDFTLTVVPPSAVRRRRACPARANAPVAVSR